MVDAVRHGLAHSVEEGAFREERTRLRECARVLA
jgi:hypothetical protein